MRTKRAKLGPASVAVVGSVTIDRVIENRKTSERLGGVVTYGGLTFQRLGVQSAVVTNIAATDRAVLEVLAAEGLTVHAGTSAVTTRFVNRAEGDWREQLMPEAADPVTAGQLKPLLPYIRHFHAGPLHPGDIEPQAMVLMAESKHLVSLDVQGYLRRPENGRMVPAVSGALEGSLRAAHIIKADEEEMTLMLDHFHLSLPGFLQRFRIDEAVITRGSRGASVWTRSGEGYHFGAEPVRRIVSTVGAGDVLLCRLPCEPHLPAARHRHGCHVRLGARGKTGGRKAPRAGTARLVIGAFGRGQKKKVDFPVE